MKYYVCSDIHSFFSPFKDALKKAGFFDDAEPHKLLILGDIMDRGQEAVEMQNFVLEQMKQESTILVRGNHEDLFENLVVRNYGQPEIMDLYNGTYNTLKQLKKCIADPNDLTAIPFLKTIIPAMRNYYETEHYIFVHGYLPGSNEESGYTIARNWRKASATAWRRARWVNGIAASLTASPDKTIVCGHWHTSYGHTLIEGRGSEFEEDADFSPFYGKNLIAIDACTAYSEKVNCIVLED